MAGIPVDPTDPTTQQSGKPPRQESDVSILRSLLVRVAALERQLAQAEGVNFISPDGKKAKTLAIDNNGDLLLGGVVPVGPVAAGVWRGPCWASPGTSAAAIMGGGNLTPSNPNGARFLVIGEWSAYASGTVQGALQTFLQIDGDDWGARGPLDQHYFNNNNIHAKCGFFLYITPTLAGGIAHGFSLIGKSISSANITCDGNDWAQLIAFEIP